MGGGGGGGGVERGPHVTYWALMKRQALLTMYANLKPQTFFLLFGRD